MQNDELAKARQHIRELLLMLNKYNSDLPKLSNKEVFTKNEAYKFINRENPEKMKMMNNKNTLKALVENFGEDCEIKLSLYSCGQTSTINLNDLTEVKRQKNQKPNVVILDAEYN